MKAKDVMNLVKNIDGVGDVPWLLIKVIIEKHLNDAVNEISGVAREILIEKNQCYKIINNT